MSKQRRTFYRVVTLVDRYPQETGYYVERVGPGRSVKIVLSVRFEDGTSEAVRSQHKGFCDRVARRLTGSKK